MRRPYKTCVGETSAIPCWRLLRIYWYIDSSRKTMQVWQKYLMSVLRVHELWCWFVDRRRGGKWNETSFGVYAKQFLVGRPFACGTTWSIWAVSSMRFMAIRKSMHPRPFASRDHHDTLPLNTLNNGSQVPVHIVSIKSRTPWSSATSTVHRPY